MKNYVIDSELLDVDYLTANGIDEDSKSQHLDNMLDDIPKEAIVLGRTQYEINNWTSWQNDDVFIILPLQDAAWQFVLIRIVFDDNWGEWGWTFDCRIKGNFKNFKKPAKLMIKDCLQRWGVTEDDEGFAVYKKLLQRIDRMKVGK